MRNLVLGALAGATLLGGCMDDGYRDGGPRYGSYRRYDYNHYEPGADGYYADRYYVDNPRYRERQLHEGDRVYAGRDGRYYCRRSDGTTGLIVGGAVAGNAIDRDHVTCR